MIRIALSVVAALFLLASASALQAEPKPSAKGKAKAAKKLSNGEMAARNLEALAKKAKDPKVKAQLLEGAKTMREAQAFVDAVDMAEQVRPTMELYIEVGEFLESEGTSNGMLALDDEKFVEHSDTVRAMMAAMKAAEVKNPDESASIRTATAEAILALAGK